MKIYHQLNIRSTAKKTGGEEFYPLMLLIEKGDTVKALHSKISGFFTIYGGELNEYVKDDKEVKKLFLSNYFRQTDLQFFENENTFPFYHLMKDEKEVLGKIVKLKQERGISEEDIFENISTEFEKYTSEITELLDQQIKKKYRDEIKRIFIHCIDHEGEKEVFSITNFFMHYINWDTNFYNFYETASDLLYASLKKLENRFNAQFKSELRSFLAYHSKVKVMKRFFEKRELGKITTISYLDWSTEVRAFLITEFEKIFGKQKSAEYIGCIDELLKHAISEKMG